MIAYAGAHATVTCPLGPLVPISIGRTDSRNAAAAGSLPGDPSFSADTLLSMFATKGFSATDVVAVVGAHTVSKQFFENLATSGQSQDSTPGVWDLNFFKQTTVATPGVTTFQSDMNLANDPRTRPTFLAFAQSQSSFNAAFVSAFKRMSDWGSDPNRLVDCSSTLPRARTSFP